MLLKLMITGLLLTAGTLTGQTQKESFLTKKEMITVKKISFPCKNPPVRLVEKMLDSANIPFHTIDVVNWSQFPEQPRVKFRIAYSQEEIYLQYVVKESYIRAFYTQDEGSAPYKDSAVEFFIIPSSTDTIYYNLELNCIGVGTFAGGPDRQNRTRFGKEVTSQIRRASTLGKEGFDVKEGDFEWTLTVALPVSLFSLSTIEPLKGRVVRANFYKCGDELPVKHYLSWNPIGTERPNFHTPQYFGEIYFED